MWKKIGVICVAFIAIISTVPAINQIMNAEAIETLNTGNSYTIDDFNLLDRIEIAGKSWAVVAKEGNEIFLLSPILVNQVPFTSEETYLSHKENAIKLVQQNAAATVDERGKYLLGLPEIYNKMDFPTFKESRVFLNSWYSIAESLNNEMWLKWNTCETTAFSNIPAPGMRCTIYTGYPQAVGYYAVGELTGGWTANISLFIRITLDGATIKGLAVTKNPENETNFYAGINAKSGNRIADLTVEKGAEPITYEVISPKTGSDTSSKFAIKETIIDDKKEYKVVANEDLSPGLYKFRVRAFDKNNTPNPPIYTDGTLVTDEAWIDKGIVSDDIEIVVYPNSTQVTLSQNKNTTTNAYYTLDELNALAANTTLGTINFDANANMQNLADEGYNVSSIKAVKPGTTTALTAFDVRPIAGNINNFEIKKLAGGNFEKGNLKFDLIVTYSKEGVDTAIVKKTDQIFVIPDPLKFVDPKDPNVFLEDATYNYTYDSDVSSNEITLVATDKTTGTALNSNVKYCVYEGNACTNTSSVVEFLSGASNGAQKIKIMPPGIENKTVTIRATLMHTDGTTIVTYEDMILTVKPTLQNLSWSGTNIQTSGNNISKDTSATNPTWNLSLKYDEETSVNNIYNLDTKLKDESLTDKNIGLMTNLVSGTTPVIEYKITPNNNDDLPKITTSNGKLEIKGKLKDSFTITAIGKATGNYSATTDVDDPTTPAINEYSHAILKVTVSDKPKVDFTEDFPNGIIAGSAMAKGTTALGTLKILPNTVTDYENYAIASVGKLKEPVVDPTNPQYDTVSSDLFRIDLATKQLFAKHSSTGLATGTYRVKVKATKNLSMEEATAKDIDVVVKNATLDASKMQWQYKDDDTAFKPSEGSIDSTNNKNLNSKPVSQVYKDNKTFQVKLIDQAGSTQISSADKVEYFLKTGSVQDIIDVSKSGAITVKKVGNSNVVVEAIITKTGVDTTSVFLPIEITQATPELQFVEDDGITPYPLQNASDKTKYKTLENEYSADKGIGVFTKGVPTGAKITFTILDKGSSSGNDVIAFKSSDSANMTCEITADDYATQRLQKCEAIIKNAQKNISDSTKIILQASTTATTNYKAMSMEMPINITKANQTDFDFATIEEMYESSQDGLIEPTFISKDQAHPNIGIGTISLFTTDADGNSDLSNDELRLGNPTSDTATYTDGIKNFIYNIVVPPTEAEKEFNIYALKEGDRNYKESDLKTQKIVITPEGTSKYRLTFKSYETAGGSFSTNVVYGHEYFHIDAKSIDDETDPSSTYTFEIIDEFKEYVEKYGSNVGDFKALKAGKIKIKVTRTSGNGVVSPSVNGTVTVEQKPVKLKVGDITKKNGMSVLTSDYTFTSNSDDFLASDKAKLDIKFSAQDSDGNDVTTLSDGIRINHNKLPITATIKNKNVNDDVLANYKIKNVDGTGTGVQSGKLIVSEEESQASWYKVEGAADTLLGNDDWYNGDVDIILQLSAGSFDRISSDAIDWKSDKYTISKEGKNTTSVYFRDNTTKIISKPQSKEIKIDSTKPVVKSVTGDKVNDNGIAKFMNAMTFGNFFKPGVEVVMESEDTNSDTTIETSGIASIEYKAYAKDGETFKEIDKGNAALSGNTGKIQLTDSGIYRVCVIAKDNAGNSSDEYCSELDVKAIDIDIDGDDTPDMNDSNEDGCPDLNIVLGKDSEGKWIKLNEDRNGDKLPELNIDSDQDGIAELNLDTDSDGKPDINLVNVTKELWKPKTHVGDQVVEYCTTPDLKASINIKVDNTSYINIDNNGDLKADVNITKSGSTIPTINLLYDQKITWKPSKDFTKDGLAYDTMDLKAEFNIDSDGDGLPDINVDMTGDRKPDINIDVDDDGIPDINIDGDGDGERDFNIDNDEDGVGDENNIDLDEWNPSIKKDDFGTMDIVTKDELEDGGIKVERENGKFLANYALRVNNVTDSISDSEKSAIGSVIGSNQEIKQVYNVAMMKGETSVQPNGKLKVRIPVVKGLKNPKIVIAQKDGSQKIIDAIDENGYYVYENDYLGNVSIIGDKEEVPVPKEEPVSSGGSEKPSTTNPTVKGNYTSGGVGGAGTGDITQSSLYITVIAISIGFIGLALYTRKKENHH